MLAGRGSRGRGPGVGMLCAGTRAHVGAPGGPHLYLITHALPGVPQERPEPCPAGLPGIALETGSW